MSSRPDWLWAGSLLHWVAPLSTKLGYTPAVPLLQASLAEEKATDEKLGKLGQAAAIEEAAEGA